MPETEVSMAFPMEKMNDSRTEGEKEHGSREKMDRNITRVLGRTLNRNFELREKITHTWAKHGFEMSWPGPWLVHYLEQSRLDVRWLTNIYSKDISFLSRAIVAIIYSTYIDCVWEAGKRIIIEACHKAPGALYGGLIDGGG